VGVLGLIAGRRVGRYFGALAVLIPLVIYMYYVLIEAWCLRYAWAYLSGSLDLGQPVAGRLPEAEAFFARVSGSGANGSLLTSEPAGLVFWLLVIAANALLIRRGLARGIEAFCRWALPLMAACAALERARPLCLYRSSRAPPATQSDDDPSEPA
jgi:NSS family neurotransmitter:Na+ symporter